MHFKYLETNKVRVVDGSAAYHLVVPQRMNSCEMVQYIEPFSDILFVQTVWPK